MENGKLSPSIHSTHPKALCQGWEHKYTPTRSRRRLTWFSRTPATGHIGDIWHVAAERAGAQTITVDRPPDIDPEGLTRRSYADWAKLVDLAAARLYDAGARPWTPVAIMKRNHFDVALLACAAARLGAIPAQLAGAYDPVVAHALLRRLGRPLLVTDAHHVASCGLGPDEVAALTARTVCLDRVDGRSDLLPFTELSGDRMAPVELRRADEPMVVTHTSGTTGVPKLLVHAAESAYALALVEAERWPFFGLRKKDVLAFCNPYSHQRMTTAMLAMGTVTPSMLLLSEPRAPAVRKLLLEHRPTVVETLPNVYLMWEELAKDPSRPFADVRVYINSFDAIHTRTIRTFLDASARSMPLWVQSWSQSEAGPIVIRPYTRRSVRERGRRPPPTQILGWPIPGFCKLRATHPDTGEPVPRGQPGLIEISQPGRCLGYVDEQHRHDAKCRGRWWNTGDIGIIGRFGAVRLLDREIDRLEGASGLEIEDVLLDRLPTTTEIVVLAVAGSKPVPILSTKDDRPIDPSAWARATADLPPLSAPLHIKWDDFPRTATWKIRRLELRRRFLSGGEPVGVGRWT